MIRASALGPLWLLAIAGCPNPTDTWPDPDTSDTDTDTDTDSDSDSDSDSDTSTSFTTHCGVVNGDELWTAETSPHFIGCDVKIESGTVTVEAGAQLVVLEDASIRVSEGGRTAGFVVAGTAEAPVTIAPEDPDQVGPFWEGVRIYPDAVDVSLRHVVIAHGGDVPNVGGGVWVNQNEIHVDHVTIEDSAGTGLVLAGGSWLRDDSTSLVVTGSAGYAVSVSGSEAHTLPSAGSVYSGNGIEGIEVKGDTLVEDVLWEDLGVPYMVVGSVAIENYVGNPAVLTIGAGATLLFDVGTSLSLSPNGGESGLIVDGLPDRPVSLSSLGAATGGYWEGIFVNQGATQVELKNGILEWGGGRLVAFSSLDVKRATVHVENFTIKTSAKWGFALTDGARFSDDSFGLTITGCVFPGQVPSVYADKIPTGNYAGNTYDAFRLSGAIDRPTFWPKLDVPYWIATDIPVEGVSTRPAVLTVEAGTTVWMDTNTEIDFANEGGAAGLIALGTAQDPIVFTAAEFAEPGAWDGLFFRDMCQESEVQLDHVTIEWGGNDIIDDYNLLFFGCNAARATNLTIRGSVSYGLGLIQSLPAQYGPVTFDGNFSNQFCGFGQTCPSP